MIVAEATGLSHHRATHTCSTDGRDKFSHFLVECECALVAMPADGLRITPRSARSVVAVIVVFALAVLVGPVINETRRRSVRSTCFVKAHVGFVSGFAPEFSIFGIDHGKDRHVGRVKVTRILAVVTRIAPLVARQMQAVRFEFGLFHGLDELLGVFLVLFIAKLVVSHHESGGSIDIAIESGTVTGIPRLRKVTDLPNHEAVFVHHLLVEVPNLVELRLIARRIVTKVDHQEHAVADTFREIRIGTRIGTNTGNIALFVVHGLHPVSKLGLQFFGSLGLVAQKRRISTVIGHLREREVHLSLGKSKSEQAGKTHFHQTIHTQLQCPHRAVKSI